jgi:hypothetical protein
MIRPFHTLPDFHELGLLVARIQNGAGEDRDLDEAVMALFFTRDSRHIGARWADTDEPVKSDVWVNPLTDRFAGTGPRDFTCSLDHILWTTREFLPGSQWMIQAPSEQPATALVKHGAEYKARTAATPQRALLTAFLCLADQVQRAQA